MKDAWEFLGHAEERLERPEEALAAYREALAPARAARRTWRWRWPRCCFELGRVPEAEEHARLALAAHASFAHGVLAQAALRRERPCRRPRGRALATGAGGNGDRVGPALTLAAVEHAEGHYEAALGTPSTRRPPSTRGASARRPIPDLV